MSPPWLPTALRGIRGLNSPLTVSGPQAISPPPFHSRGFSQYPPPCSLLSSQFFQQTCFSPLGALAQAVVSVWLLTSHLLTRLIHPSGLCSRKPSLVPQTGSGPLYLLLCLSLHNAQLTFSFLFTASDQTWAVSNPRAESVSVWSTP